MNGERHDDWRNRLADELEAVRVRAEKTTSWRTAMQYLSQLINREGYVPVRARLSHEDLAFIANARDEVLSFAELGLRLLELHQPRDAGGISSDPGNPILRCRSCMWRWPCPTFRAIAESLERLA